MKIAALIARLLLAFLGMPVLLLIGASKAHAISMLLIVLPVSAAGFLLLPLRQLPAWARWSAAILYVLWMLYVQTLTARFLVEDTP